MWVSINYDRNNLITIRPEDSKYEISSKEEINKIFDSTIETLTNLITESDNLIPENNRVPFKITIEYMYKDDNYDGYGIYLTEGTDKVHSKGIIGHIDINY